MRLLSSMVVACGLLVIVAHAEEKKNDKDALQGSWMAVSGTEDGKAMAADKIKDAVVTFKGDKLVLKHGGQESEHTFKIDSSKNPKEMDVDFDGKPGRGIYELKGDTLRVAHGAMPDSPRPKNFESKEGSGVVVVEFKREKK